MNSGGGMLMFFLLFFFFFANLQTTHRRSQPRPYSAFRMLVPSWSAKLTLTSLLSGTNEKRKLLLRCLSAERPGRESQSCKLTMFVCLYNQLCPAWFLAKHSHGEVICCHGDVSKVPSGPLKWRCFATLVSLVQGLKFRPPKFANENFMAQSSYQSQKVRYLGIVACHVMCPSIHGIACAL